MKAFKKLQRIEIKFVVSIVVCVLFPALSLLLLLFFLDFNWNSANSDVVLLEIITSLEKWYIEIWYIFFTWLLRFVLISLHASLCHIRQRVHLKKLYLCLKKKKKFPMAFYERLCYLNNSFKRKSLKITIFKLGLCLWLGLWMIQLRSSAFTILLTRFQRW